MNLEFIWPCASIAVGIGVLIVGLIIRKKLLDSELWPKSIGTIVESKIEPGWSRVGGSFTYVVRPKVTYEYHVAGEKYMSSQLALVEINSANENSAHAKAGKYHSGQEVIVYYDPRKPSFATLAVGDPTRGKLPVGIIIFGSATTIAGIIWLLAIEK